jgi:hypothetical protein
MAKDQNTIGLSAAAAEHLKRVLDSGWFDSELDVCRVAMGVALRRATAAPKHEMTGLVTKYNVGTFDRDGAVAGVINVVGYPEGEGLYGYAERLIHAGLRLLAEDLEEEGVLLSDVLAKDTAKAGDSAGNPQD